MQRGRINASPIIVTDLTEEQQKEFIIKDNVSGGEWDWDMLANEWDIELLQDWGLDLPDVKEETEKEDLSEDLISEFKIEIECISEREQETVFTELQNRGFKCRILTL